MDGWFEKTAPHAVARHQVTCHGGHANLIGWMDGCDELGDISVDERWMSEILIGAISQSPSARKLRHCSPPTSTHSVARTPYLSRLPPVSNGCASRCELVDEGMMGEWMLRVCECVS